MNKPLDTPRSFQGTDSRAAAAAAPDAAWTLTVTLSGIGVGCATVPFEGCTGGWICELYSAVPSAGFT